MEIWLQTFVLVAAAAIILQMGILIALYLQFRQMNERIARTTAELQARIFPVLSRLQTLMEDVQPRLSSAAADVAEITHLARAQAVKVDRLFTEAVDRLRLQIIRADQLITGALEAVESAGQELRRSVSGPAQKIAALIKGIQAGLEVLRGIERSPQRSAEHPEESLFI
ncbi:MAG: hypothetical protein K6U09_04525 [Acidobacteriia bacterium]|jgi:hypothetical protein|nr:hypothetical protein [Terriglobia bacterium]